LVREKPNSWILSGGKSCLAANDLSSSSTCSIKHTHRATIFYDQSDVIYGAKVGKFTTAEDCNSAASNGTSACIVQIRVLLAALSACKMMPLGVRWRLFKNVAVSHSRCNFARRNFIIAQDHIYT